ncbi:uncharacterized protein At4g04775-like [Vicia villosa]|uniref:uncharacterized protein At4g04775-like n=1 Tax=Vicia villosa TaxID=3911 RepID=UPI00273A8216|nr:uncharacterized protein At4g04775-like [Vicia villosa]
MEATSSSSVGNSIGRSIPRCGCNESLKMFVSNTHENPRRKFWRCKNRGKSDAACDLFLWDDEVMENIMTGGKKEVFRGGELVINNSEFTVDQMKAFGLQFGKEFGKEFSKEFGLEASSKKVEKLKKLMNVERKKNFRLMVALVASWMLLFVVYKIG